MGNMDKECIKLHWKHKTETNKNLKTTIFMEWREFKISSHLNLNVIHFNGLEIIADFSDQTSNRVLTL